MEQICSAYVAVIRQALSMRNQGIPIDTATRMAESAYRINPTLGGVVGRSLTLLYLAKQLDSSWRKSRHTVPSCKRHEQY